jgi:hypothetical protein
MANDEIMFDFANSLSVLCHFHGTVLSCRELVVMQLFDFVQTSLCAGVFLLPVSNIYE